MSPNEPIFTPDPAQPTPPTPTSDLQSQPQSLVSTPEASTSAPVSSEPPNSPQPPAQPIASPSVVSQPSPKAPKSSSRTLIFGFAAALVLVVAGVIFQISRQSSSPSGASISSTEQQIADLDSEISRLSAEDAAIFQSTGFSEEFYQSSSRRTELELQKSDLEHDRDLALATSASANIFRTGAFVFFLAAALILVISITISLRLRKSPASTGASVIS